MRVCPVCSKVVEGRSDKVYCSKRCYRDANREGILEYQKAYYAINKEKVLKRQKVYCAANGKRIAERRKVYREANRERLSEYGRARYVANRERLLKYAKVYQKANREKVAEYRLDNREKTSEYGKVYRAVNREKIAERNRIRYRRGVGLPEDWVMSKESNIEALMRLWLLSSMVEFETQKKIDLGAVGGTWTRVDFFVSAIKVCLYCDGDYWHSLEGMPEKDARITEALEQLGYTVIRVSGTDIHAGQWPIEILEMLA